MRDDSQVSSKGKGTIHLEHGSFKIFLYVPSLDSNLLSVYQITHIGLPIRVVFNPDDVEISEIASGKLIVVGKENHTTKTYEFSNFVPDSKPSSLLTHGNEVSRLWHERFGHLNYKYFQLLQNYSMVEGLTAIKSSKGICKGCIVGKHHVHKFDRGKARRIHVFLG